MKNLKLNSLILLFALLGVSCTEEISEELKQASEEQATNTNLVEVSKMFLVNTTDSSLSHFLHLEGDSTKPCEVIAPSTGWKAEDYFRINATDCVMDVEELDLFRNGFNIEINVDPGLCEYVLYEPFKYANFQPGRTNREQYSFACDEVCAEKQEDYCANLEGKVFDSFTGGSVNTSFLDRTIRPYYDEVLEAHECEFDHNDPDTAPDAPNCDEGKITTRHYTVTSYERTWCDGGEVNLDNGSRLNTEGDCETAGTWVIPETGDCDINAGDADEATCLAQLPVAGVWTPDPSYCEGFTDANGNGVQDLGERLTEEQCITAGQIRQRDCSGDPTLTLGAGPTDHKDMTLEYDEEASEELDCGGDSMACFEGPGVDIINGEEGLNGEIIQNGALEAVKVEYETESPLSKGFGSNRYIASYQSTFSSSDTKLNLETIGLSFKGDELELTPLHYGSGSNYSIFDPFTSFIDPFVTHFRQAYPVHFVDKDNNGTDDYAVYGTHPFMSVSESGEVTNGEVKPYYAVKCLDQSRDVKAQIRLHVREWDRSFNEDSLYLNRISDRDIVGADPLMDNEGYHDGDEAWNDRNDWDNWWVAADNSNPPIYTPRVFTNNNARNVIRSPTNGQCYEWSGGVFGPDVTPPIHTNKRDCNAQLLGTPGLSCSDTLIPTRFLCLNAGESWRGSLWIQDDDSHLNFPSRFRN